MKVIFAGTPEFAATALQSLHEAGFESPTAHREAETAKAHRG